MKGRARTALIGAGFVGRVHLENLMRSGCAEVAVLVSAPADLVQARKVAAQYGINEVEADYRPVLKDASIDAVHICTPNSLCTPPSPRMPSKRESMCCARSHWRIPSLASTEE